VISQNPIFRMTKLLRGDSMSRPPQNLCLIDYFLSQCETVFVWYRFSLREKLKERRRGKIAKFIALTRLFPLRTHKLNQVRLLGKWGR
jgi:hypothetical protein